MSKVLRNMGELITIVGLAFALRLTPDQVWLPLACIVALGGLVLHIQSRGDWE